MIKFKLNFIIKYFLLYLAYFYGLCSKNYSFTQVFLKLFEWIHYQKIRNKFFKTKYKKFYYLYKKNKIFCEKITEINIDLIFSTYK